MIGFFRFVLFFWIKIVILVIFSVYFSDDIFWYFKMYFFKYIILMLFVFNICIFYVYICGYFFMSI